MLQEEEDNSMTLAAIAAAIAAANDAWRPEGPEWEEGVLDMNMEIGDVDGDTFRRLMGGDE